ncbi:MAG: DUF6438 domain-containing protein [Pseudomonadota bacterium]
MMVLGTRTCRTFALMFFLGACEPLIADEEPKATVPDDFRVTLDRSFCFGNCPSYAVTIRSSGEVEYCGEGFVEMLGEHRKTISVAAVAELASFLENARFFELRDGYIGRVSDQPAYQVSVQMNGHTKTVLNYAGEFADMPSIVTQIEDAIDHTAETSTWIGNGGGYDHEIDRPICKNRPTVEF